MRLPIFSATAKTKSIAVTDSSSSVALPSTGNTIRLVNESAYPCYNSIGDGTQIATVQIDAVCRTGYSATLLVSVGEGC